MIIANHQQQLKIDPAQLALLNELRAERQAELAWVAFVRRSTVPSAYQYGTLQVAVEHVDLELMDVAILEVVAAGSAEAVPPLTLPQGQTPERFAIDDRAVAELVQRAIEEKR